MSNDRYNNFSELKNNETEGIDYIIRYQNKMTKWAVLTPHGGGIEPGTSELVKAIANDNYSYYSLEGTKRKNNGDLHITSEFFDEIHGIEIAESAENILAFHGCAKYPSKILVGGLDIKNRALLTALLQQAGFNVDNNPPPELSGSKPNNICNRGKTGIGIQLELDVTVRKKLFKGLDRKGRIEKMPAFYDLVKAVKEFLKKS